MMQLYHKLHYKYLQSLQEIYKFIDKYTNIYKCKRYLLYTKIGYYIESETELQRQGTGRRS